MKKERFIVILLLFYGTCVWGIGESPSKNVKKVLVVYYSLSGHTRLMAEAAAEGARSVEGVKVKLLSVREAKAADALEADGIIIGSPVYNANVAPAILKYINSWPFEGAPMRDKVGAALVTGGGISVGEELVQVSILHSLLVHGMIVVGGMDWQSSFGASAVMEEKPFDTVSKKQKVAAYFLEKAKGLGIRVAHMVKKVD